ncbi:MAG: SGNH/GDSL hydrolase family protein [Deltaproteobacteria bacterium]|nr:SGNH/GDSL hydrolase family protein [Deltaproteobacteria bacterium]
MKKTISIGLLITCWVACGSDRQAQTDDASLIDGSITVSDSRAVDGSLPDAELPLDALLHPDLLAQAKPDLGKPTLFVNLGDSIAAGYGVPSDLAFRSLLFQNVDSRYPAYAKQDLSSRYPGIQIYDRALAGSTSDELRWQVAAVPANTTGGTLVSISIGGNDLLSDVNAMVVPEAVKNKGQEVIANIKHVIDHFSDAKNYPGKATFLIFTVYDPTDHMGTIPKEVKVIDLCEQVKAFGPLIGTTLAAHLRLFNNELIQFAKQRSNVLVVDTHAGFLGHGYHYADTQSTFYDANDPSLWFSYDCLHPNIRGHHEIRRIIWDLLN